jgi:hypothetical protein
MEPITEDEERLRTLLNAVGRVFPVIVLDLPAEFTNVSRAACGLISRGCGVAFLVNSTLFGNLGLLLENYLRLLATGTAFTALMLNKIRPLDMPRLNASNDMDGLLDFLVSRPSGLSVFGLRIHSPAILKSILGRDKFQVLSIPLSEDLEAGMRDSRLDSIYHAFDSSAFNPVARLVGRLLERLPE